MSLRRKRVKQTFSTAPSLGGIIIKLSSGARYVGFLNFSKKYKTLAILSVSWLNGRTTKLFKKTEKSSRGLRIAHTVCGELHIQFCSYIYKRGYFKITSN